MATTRFVIADYNNPEHARILIALVDEYASEPMGGGEPLPEFAKQNLAKELAKVPGAFSIFGFQEERAIALANCLPSFSTFACKPLINIHDLMVSQSVRGQGISQQLLTAVESEATKRGCCKITLEVLQGNSGARAAYAKFGFKDYRLDETTGHALFMQKSIPNQ
jgi:GNAT superfamily N-acetyltransferase